MRETNDERQTTNDRKTARRPSRQSSVVSRGFTLVELLVVMGIVTIISTVILTRYSQFNNTILLSNLAYDMALSVRQAQVFGLSVREQTVGSGAFNTGYGIYFSKDSPTSYLLFADVDNNRHYDESGDTVIEVFNVRRGYQIVQFCVYQADGTSLCTPEAIEALSATFKRPDPDASVEATPDAENPSANQTYSSAVIRVRSLQGEERSVTIASTGQISVGY